MTKLVLRADPKPSTSRIIQEDGTDYIFVKEVVLRFTPTESTIQITQISTSDDHIIIYEGPILEGFVVPFDMPEKLIQSVN